MNNKVYINGISSISAQTEASVFGNNPIIYKDSIFPAVAIDYKKYIPAQSLRRLSKALRMSISGASMALKDAGNKVPDSIITGTGQGCKQDTERFLETMIVQEEELLSPTAFIHSTHNTIGGQIALYLNNKAYNITYSQNSGSLEWALIDAQMQLYSDSTPKNILVGGVDEISKTITGFMKFDHQLKAESISNLELLNSKTSGTIASEGAHFFTLSSQENNSTYAEMLDVSVISKLDLEEISENIKEFLEKNNVKTEDIDLLILGKNGDVNYDNFYNSLEHDLFKETQQLAYKHLVGEYNTVSGYALWLACKIIKDQTIPDILKLNLKKTSEIKHVLLYNQYLGENHSFILLRKI